MGSSTRSTGRRVRRAVAVALSVAMGAATAIGVWPAPTAAAAHPQPAAEELALDVAGREGIPDDAEAVVLNVTVTEPDRPGWLVVHPCGQALPTASNLNFGPGQTVPNLVVAKVGSGGRVCLFGTAITHVVVDVAGYFPSGSSFTPLGSPQRLLDTRLAATGRPAGRQPAGTALAATVAGTAGIPADAEGVVMNVTATEPDRDGWVVAWPCGQPLPTASNLNVAAGGTVPNLVVARPGTAGQVCFLASPTTHLVVDVAGYFPAGAGWTPLASPRRLLDSRESSGWRVAGLLPAGSELAVPAGGTEGLPGGDAAIAANVTVTAPTGPGYLVAYPCGSARPTASNLNFTAGATVANLTMTGLGTSGRVCLWSSAAAHVVLDVAGHVDTGPDYEALPAPRRLLDTRGRMSPAETSRMLTLVNGHRSVAGSPPVAACTALDHAAQLHSLDQLAMSTMSHTGSDGSSAGTRITRAGYDWNTYGENVAYGYETVDEVVQGWMDSPGHRANLLNPNFTHLGLGVADEPPTWWWQPRYWTQVFGRGGTC